MGKRGKNHKPYKQQRDRRIVRGGEEAEDDLLPSSAYDIPLSEAECLEEADDEEAEENKEAGEEGVGAEEAEKVDQIDGLSKFHLYQKSVQSPKGDISYLQKFFLMYVGGRVPVHLQEDFCGTALLSTEWLRSDPRRTAVGLDLDLEALIWCLENNLPMVGSDSHSRLSLFHGNVLQPPEAQLVASGPNDLLKAVMLDDQGRHVEAKSVEGLDSAVSMPSITSMAEVPLMKNCILPARDIICAFNYSCCCLQKRSELLLYFRYVLHSLSKRGGIFVMDLYGGTSSEKKLQLRRKFSNFTYIWEQAEFDVVNRKTRISLHFQLARRQTLRHAFSYHWRLWSLPEIKDCLEEAGFKSVHVWIREMPDTCDTENTEEFNASKDVKYEDHPSFQQRDAWNAYIVGVSS